MSTTKKISLIAILVLVVGGIWYLQSMKVQPGGGAATTTSQNIAVTADGSLPATTATVSGVSASSTTVPVATSSRSAEGTASPASIAAALKALAIVDQKAGYVSAKEITNPTGFINASSSFTLASLIGKKPILLDFWTYSCINCIRTIPHLNAWQGAYASSGLEIVGIHTPEFDFEKDITNVQAAVKQYDIHYPVILDSNYGTWNAYGNLYWPEEYLIDMAGYVVHQNIGEGDYPSTEAEIQSLIKQRADIFGLPEPQFSGDAPVVAVTAAGGPMSPETYFGSGRNEYLANGTIETAGTQTLTTPATLTVNSLYLGGTWNFAGQYATNMNTGATVMYEYQASKVYIVAASASGASTTIQVFQDDKPVTAAEAGSDVQNGILTVGPSRLYGVIANPDGSGTHTLKLIINGKGLQAYTFTFG